MTFSAKTFRFPWRLLALGICLAGVMFLISVNDPVYFFSEHFPTSSYKQFDGLIVAAGKKHDVDPTLIKAVIWKESKFRPETEGKAGERGLMQVTEIAAKDWVQALKVETFVPMDLFDPKTNIDVGTWYLARALRRHQSLDDPRPFALAEYNAGASRVTKWRESKNPSAALSATEFMTLIDFPQTVRYVRNILDRQVFYQKRGEFSEKGESLKSEKNK